MFKTILVPVDLEHADKLAKALDIAAGLALQNGAALHVVGVASPLPGAGAHTPGEYAEKLAAFAARTGEPHGLEVTPHALTVSDPAVEANAAILNQAEALGADLLVMATRVPGFAERLFSSHGNYIASHASMSVFLVR